MLVESAFVFPILILLLFGIIEWGVILKDMQTLTSASRSGARTASAEARNTNYDTDASTAVAAAFKGLAGNNTPVLLEIYLADPTTGMPWNSGMTGDETTFSSSCSHCSFYTWNSTTQSWNVATTRNWPANGSTTLVNQNACPLNSVSNPSGPDTLGVYVEVTHQMLTPLFGATKTLKDRTAVKLEPQPSTTSSCKGQ